MLLRLSIRNYILIHSLDIDLSGGFSTITGETGAGKSILLGALSLIIGQRADSGILLDKEKKCIIEGQFSIKGYNLEGFFSTSELDYDDFVILRREINQNGKSRAFINDTPVNLTLLKELGDKLVNVHSQHSIVTLNDSNFQLAVIDSYAGLQTEINAFRTEYANLIEIKTRLANLEDMEIKASGERDYNQFLLDELCLAGIIPGEVHEIEEELGLLTHAEEVRSSLFRANNILGGSEDNILDRLTETVHQLNGVAKYKSELQNILERINANYIDFKDIFSELTHIEEQIFIDPPRIETLTQRLDNLNRLMKKHQVHTDYELLTIKAKIEKYLADEIGMDERIRVLRAEMISLEHHLLSVAEMLSKKRKKAVPRFEQEVTGILYGLGIPKARFTIDIQTSETTSKDGIDKVKFLFSANKGIELKELSVTASGGELSRLMLAIKSMVSQKNLLPTIIFDEIDNGVSGEIAGKVASILKKMGSFMQVIAITHLPQIAAKGDHHFWVYKVEDHLATTTYIKKLSPQDRILEIAKMLSSETVTDSAFAMANELINN
jgi:DNA repair protein RecN (Recombination protein N)